MNKTSQPPFALSLSSPQAGAATPKSGPNLCRGAGVRRRNANLILAADAGALRVFHPVGAVGPFRILALVGNCALHGASFEATSWEQPPELDA